MKYYLHDTSAIDDEKVAELFIRFGYEGVGLFYVILEKIGKQEKPIKTLVLKSQLKVGKRLEKCWNFMEEIGLISSNNGETFNKQLLNYSEKYKIRKEKNAKRISEWRKNQESIENVTCYEQVCNSPKVKKSKVKEIKIILRKRKIQKRKRKQLQQKLIPLWKKDFNEYQKLCKSEFEKYFYDDAFIKEQEYFHSNLDIDKTMQKAMLQYWITKDGWTNMKKRKGEIDWKRTIVNAINSKLNHVYKDRAEQSKLKF